MSRTRRLTTSRALRWGVMVAVALMLLACAPAAFAAPKTTHAAAYEVMKKWMQRYDKDGFAKVVDYGGSKTYRVRLAQTRILVNPNLPPSPIDGRPPLATYDPVTDTISFLKDPRKAPEAEKDALGKTVWHEVTHALEDKNGDDFTNDDPLYQDRNIYYMESVVEVALPFLDRLELNAKAGESVEKLRGYWDKYLAETEAAAKLPETLKYPPDLALMRKWFGFRADPAEVKALYLTDKAFSGKEWKNLREALTPPAPATWTGEWRQSFNGPPPQLSLPISFLQSGASVTGTYYYVEGGPTDREGFPLQGTLSADGMTMTGSWIDSRWAYPNGGAHETFVIVVAADWRSWSGTCTWGNGSGTQGWWGWR